MAFGPYHQWWPDGSLKTEGTLKLGVHVGEWRSWHRNGQSAKHILYTERGVDVSGRLWDKEGNLVDDYGKFPEDGNSASPPEN